MAIAATGIGSGLDVNSLVSQLMAVERRPLDLLSRAGTNLQSTLSAFGRMSSAISSFQDAATALSSPSKWQLFQAQSSDTTAVVATAGSTALEGNYAVRVDRLAKSHALASGTFPASTTAVGTGSITIELGSYDTANGFVGNPSKTPVTINIATGSDSLAQVRDAINRANAGVTASIANTGTGARLMLTSRETGETTSMRITVADADGTNADAAGLSQLAFDPAATAGNGRNLTQTQPAENALLNVNGIDITSASNTVSNAIDGLTLNLRKTTPTAMSVDVARDMAAIKKSVDAFVSAYNELNKTIGDLTRFDAATKQGGALQGDRTAVGVQSQLRSMMRSTFSGASGDFVRLSDVGIEQQSDGSVRLNQSKWDSAATNVDRVIRLFSNAGTTTAPETQGFAKRLEGLAKSLLGDQGIVAGRSEGIRRSITTNQRSQESMQDRLALTEKRLRTQYQTLDTKLSSIQAQSSYLTQQLTALSNQNRNN
jgi:flagellar hook-associated protein 2